MARVSRSTHRRERRLHDIRGFGLIELVVTLALRQIRTAPDGAVTLKC